MVIVINPKITISNKVLYTFIAVSILLTISGIVYAFTYDGSGDPAVMGHSADEVLYVQTYDYPKMAVNNDHSYRGVACTKTDAAAYCAIRGQIFVNMTCEDSGINELAGINYVNGIWLFNELNGRWIKEIKCAWGFDGPIADTLE